MFDWGEYDSFYRSIVMPGWGEYDSFYRLIVMPGVGEYDSFYRLIRDSSGAHPYELSGVPLFIKI